MSEDDSVRSSRASATRRPYFRNPCCVAALSLAAAAAGGLRGSCFPRGGASLTLAQPGTLLMMVLDPLKTTDGLLDDDSSFVEFTWTPS